MKTKSIFKPSSLIFLSGLFILTSCTGIDDRQARVRNILGEGFTAVHVVTSMLQEKLYTVWGVVSGIVAVGQNTAADLQRSVTEIEQRVQKVQDGVEKIQEGKELLEEGLQRR